MADRTQKITAKEVGYVAKLARLELSEQEMKGFTDVLNDILTYMDTLSEIDTASRRWAAHRRSGRPRTGLTWPGSPDWPAHPSATWPTP